MNFLKIYFVGQFGETGLNRTQSCNLFLVIHR